MIRYEPVTVEEVNLLDEVRTRWFRELWEAKILVLFDTKMVRKGGRIVLGKIKRANDLERLLTMDDEGLNPVGYDYVLTLDKMAWVSIGREDRVKILRHELRHVYFDIGSEDYPYRLVPHDFEDFRQEVVLNADDPDWGIRVAQMTADLYEQQKDAGKDKIQIQKVETIGDRVSVRRNLRVVKQ